MLKSLVDRLRCPIRKKGKPCQGQLQILGDSTGEEIVYGALECRSCHASHPILEGVAILVPDLREYLLTHVKGISKFVPDIHIPESLRDEFREYREALEEEHIEEDLESDRVNALYLMNHYLEYGDGTSTWWRGSASSESSESPWISEWLSRYWDRGPFEKVASWIPQGSQTLELGCGVGGLVRRLRLEAARESGFYLGVDSSFHSILLARHLNLGAPYRGDLLHPGDLLFGNLSRKLEIPVKRGRLREQRPAAVEFIVGEMDSVPVESGAFDVSVSMNAMDMLSEPKGLPEAQFASLRPGGLAIQTGPYVWHERVARGLRGRMPKSVQDSAQVVEWLYRISGFEIERSEPHIPWLFFKHLRQIELYSVHALAARRPK